jgi:hypothetical protein
MHYSLSTGEYTHTEWEIYDHNGKYLKLDDGVFSNSTYLYNDDGYKIEDITKYYSYPEENIKRYYTYDEDGNVLTIEVLNADDIMVRFHRYTYDDEGNQTSSKSGTDEENLTEDEVYVYEIYDENSTDNNQVIKYNEEGKLTYSEYNYGYFKDITEYSYDKDGSRIKEVYTSISDNESQSRINTYTEEGNLTGTEFVYKNGDETLCRYNSKSTYTKDRLISTTTNRVLEGDCSKMLQSEYTSYLYNEVGNVVEIKSKLFLDEEFSEKYTTLKMFSFYSNELDE